MRFPPSPSAPRFVYGPKSADVAVGIAGLIPGYTDDRSAVIRGLTTNFFATHTDVSTDPFLQFFERPRLDQASLLVAPIKVFAPPGRCLGWEGYSESLIWPPLPEVLQHRNQVAARQPGNGRSLGCRLRQLVAGRVVGLALTEHAGQVDRTRCVGGQRGSVAWVRDGTPVDGEAAAADAGVQPVAQPFQGLYLFVQPGSPMLATPLPVRPVRCARRR